MAGFKFEINEEGMRQLEQQLQEQFADGLQVPLGGSETEAIESVKDQLRKMGVEPNDDEVVRIVREVRQNHGSS